MSNSYVVIDGVNYVKVDYAKQKTLNAIQRDRKLRDFAGTKCSVIGVVPHYTTMGNLLRLELVHRGTAPGRLPDLEMIKPGSRIAISLIGQDI